LPAPRRKSPLTERNAHLEADVQVSRTNIEKRVKELNVSLQRERMGHAVVEGALEAARKDNSRLQGEVAALRSALRRGVPLEQVTVTVPEAANEDAPVPLAKRKKAQTQPADTDGKS
jgi:crescentin